MKTAVAESFVAVRPDHAGAGALLITSDDEGLVQVGTLRIFAWLQGQAQTLDACIVGEATSVDRLGDMIKNGRRGSLSGRLRVRGVQGHVAYPHLARNPLHELPPALAELVATRWDEGNVHFPSTTWQVSNLNAGAGARNVIPGLAELDFNFRFSPAATPESLQQRVHEILTRHHVDHEIDGALGGEACLTDPGTLSLALTQAITAECVTPVLSTTGGPSDGRFIKRICPQVVEFGPVSATIHQVDERVEVATIEPLTRVYLHTLELLLV